MAVSFDTYYINATLFEDATSVFTDANMTTTAPDGTYQFNGIYRTMSGGVLGSPFFCDTCCAGCSSTYIYPVPSGKNRQYEVCSSIGTQNRQAIVVKFKFTSASTQDLGYPLGLAAEYDGDFYQGVTSNRHGYLSELYIGDAGLVSPSDLAGTYTLDGFAWQPLTSSFVSAPDTTRAISSGDVSNVLGNPDECYLLIPKMSSVNTVNVDVYSPRPSLVPPLTSGSGVDVTIPCPTPLDRINVSSTQASRAAACGETFSDNAYIMRVNSASGTPAMFDRAFADMAGQTALSEGYYLIRGIVGANSRSAWIHVVGSNGVIQSVGTCEDLTFSQPELAQVICSEMRTSELQACLYQNQQGVNLPDQSYWFDGSGDTPQVGDTIYSDVTGTTTVPDGYYQLLRSYIIIRTISGVVQSPISSCT